MEFIINEFLKDAKEITITKGKMIDEQGNERTPKLTTPQQLNAGGIYCYKNLNNNVIIESLESDKKIKNFIKDYYKKEKYTRAKEKARADAIEWQLSQAKKSASYMELLKAQEKFLKLAKRYGLLKEFKENCII